MNHAHLLAHSIFPRVWVWTHPFEQFDFWGGGVMGDLVWVRSFFPNLYSFCCPPYNGISFFPSIIGHESYFFPPGISLRGIFPSKSVSRKFQSFFLKSPILSTLQSQMVSPLQYSVNLFLYWKATRTSFNFLTIAGIVHLNFVLNSKFRFK